MGGDDRKSAVRGGGGSRGRGGRGGGRGGRGASRGGSSFRSDRGSSERGGRGGSRGGDRGSGRGGDRGSGRGASRGFSGRGGREQSTRGAPRDTDSSSPAKANPASAFFQSEKEKLKQAKLEAAAKAKKELKAKAKSLRIDPRINSISIGAKQKWIESTETSTKLSVKFFSSEKLKKIKITINTTEDSKPIRYRTDIHFDDITQAQISQDLNTFTVHTRIPTLFEVGNTKKDADGVPQVVWEEGRDIEWQKAAKNAHPNKYVICFKEGAFRVDNLATLVASDSRIKGLLEKSSPHIKDLDLNRGTKRERSAESEEDVQIQPPAKKQKTAKYVIHDDSDSGSDQSDSEEEPKKKKIKSKETKSSEKPKETKAKETKSNETKMDVDEVEKPKKKTTQKQSDDTKSSAKEASDKKKTTSKEVQPKKSSEKKGK